MIFGIWRTNQNKSIKITKEIAEQEVIRTEANRMELHLWKEGSFLRAYDWSAWLACRYLHEFKVNKRQFKGIDSPVAFIGFPDTSLMKWLPEGADQRVEGEKHLVIRLPDTMMRDEFTTMQTVYAEWKETIPLTDSQGGQRKASAKRDGELFEADAPKKDTLTSIMQRILAFPIESKSPLDSVMFLADIKKRLAALI